MTSCCKAYRDPRSARVYFLKTVLLRKLSRQMAKLYSIRDVHGLHDCVLSPVGGPRGVSAKSLFSGVRAYGCCCFCRLLYRIIILLLLSSSSLLLFCTCERHVVTLRMVIVFMVQQQRRTTWDLRKRDNYTIAILSWI